MDTGPSMAAGIISEVPSGADTGAVFMLVVINVDTVPTMADILITIVRDLTEDITDATIVLESTLVAPLSLVFSSRFYNLFFAVAGPFLRTS
jgi:hypothetical protein